MIRLPEKLREKIEREALAALPQECCGLLVGADLAVTRLVPSPNLANGNDRFEIDPGLHIGWQRKLRDGKEQVIGLYHSHPTGEAAPSDRDLEDAAYPGWIWLITGLGEKKKPLTRAYRFFDDVAGRRFEQQQIVSE